MTSMIDRTLYATDRRTMLFIDSGYVLKSMARHYGRATIAPLQVKVQEFSDFLIGRAEEALACPVLRTHWFDVRDPYGEIPNIVAGEMSRVPGMKVRYGTLVTREGRLQEKGVDALIVRDLIMASVKRTANDLVLISGDGDLIPGVEEAQEQGARVHLWAIGGKEQPPSVARALQEAADTTTVLDVGEMGAFFSVKEARRVSVSQEPATAAPPPAPNTEHAPKEPRPIPTPAQIPPPTRHVATAEVYRANSQDFPRLYDLSPADFGRSVESDAPFDVGAMYAVRWWMHASPTEQQRMVDHVENDQHPGGVPYSIDGDLLGFAEDRGVDTWGPTSIKFAVRDGFAKGIRRASQR